MPFSRVYPLYVQKVEKKGRDVEELDQVIRWLTGFDDEQLREQLESGATLQEFFAVSEIHPNSSLITGSICGVKVQQIEDSLMQKIRYMDKLVDELAKGWPMAKILRSEQET